MTVDWDYSSREADVLAEIPVRLAQLQPRVVMLFGSRAAGGAAPDSDFDLLVVMPVVDPSRPRTPAVRSLLRGLGVPFDVIVYTPEEWDAFKAHPQSMAHQIIRTGRVLLGSP